jgi:hypothetical protein
MKIATPQALTGVARNPAKTEEIRTPLAARVGGRDDDLGTGDRASAEPRAVASEPGRASGLADAAGRFRRQAGSEVASRPRASASGVQRSSPLVRTRPDSRRYAEAPGQYFRRWWQVLGSNQRRLSRRFYRELPGTATQGHSPA